MWHLLSLNAAQWRGAAPSLESRKRSCRARCHTFAKDFKLIPRLITTKQLHYCFQAVKMLYNGRDWEHDNAPAHYVDQNQFIDVVMHCALMAFGRSTATNGEGCLSLDNYSDTARAMWTQILLVCLMSRHL